MGGCFESGEENQQTCQKRVDSCVDFDLPETKVPEPENSKDLALEKFLRHKDEILEVNPIDKDHMDEALRSALTYLMTGQKSDIPKGTEQGLRYIRDRVNVPRDMPIWSARRLREALETTAEANGDKQGPEIPYDHRKDQDPKWFRNHA